MKIDGSFISELKHNQTDQHLVKAIVEVARGLGKQTIAEFVGCEETMQLLSEYGVDYAQGTISVSPAPYLKLIYVGNFEEGCVAKRPSRLILCVISSRVQINPPLEKGGDEGLSVLPFILKFLSC